MIFLNGRFRSGTTLLWQLFRRIPSTHAYYEPFHDALPEYVEASLPPDPTHVGVVEYFAEYKDIIEELKVSHRADFGVSRLCLNPNDTHDEMLNYIKFLANAAHSKKPVFKFVRTDFRLPWIRNNFREGKIISIKRNPRDNWLSIISKTPQEERNDDVLNTGFDLAIWSANLAPYFPAIGHNTGHSYARHYLIWKLSSVVAKKYSDLVVDFDNDLMLNPKETIAQMLEIAEIEHENLDDLASAVDQNPSRNWQQYSNEISFSSIEQKCEKLLEKHGLIEHIESLQHHEPVWEVASKDIFPSQVTKALSLEIAKHRKLLPGIAQTEMRNREVISELIDENNRLKNKIKEIEMQLAKDRI